MRALGLYFAELDDLALHRAYNAAVEDYREAGYRARTKRNLERYLAAERVVEQCAHELAERGTTVVLQLH